MKQPLEKRWWFELPRFAAAILIVQALFHAAGLEDMVGKAGFSFARMVIWCCCFSAVERTISGVLWLFKLLVAPGRSAEQD